MVHNGYFEGVVQLRNVNQEIVDFVILQFEKNKIFIAKTINHKNGVDLYSSSNKFSRKLGKMLVKKFGGEIKESPQLFTRKRITSKNVYRLNVFYKAPEFLKDDVVAIDDKIIKVTSAVKNQLKGTNIITGKKEMVQSKGATKLEPVKTYVCSLKPQVEAIHPTTYQSVKVENTKAVKLNQNISVVIFKNKLYIL